MDLKLERAGVLITGGSRGLGLELALGFAREGARVAVCARGADELEAAAAKVRAIGADCVAIPGDLHVAMECIRIVNEAASTLGSLHVLVNNASDRADTASSALGQITDEQILERLLGKTMAAVRCTRAAIPHMRRGGWGRIVCIGGTSSRSVFRKNEMPISGSTVAHGLGNAGLASFAKHVSEEVARDGITVNVVHPHITRTGRFPARMALRARALGVTEAEAEASLAAEIPLGRILEMDDLVPLIVFMASPLTAGITGQSLAVDGGALRGIVF